MTTKLEKPLRREVSVDGVPHTLTIDTDGLKLVKKGCRNGVDMTYAELNQSGSDSASGQKRVPGSND